MKSLVCSLLLLSGSAFAEPNLPILGEYQLHQRLEGGCFGISQGNKFSITYSERSQTLSLFLSGTTRRGFREPEEYRVDFFSTNNGLGIHRSEPTNIGYVHVETATPFNEGRGLHTSYVITLPGTGERNVIVDGTFEIEGEFLYANFRQTRSYGQQDAGKCVLKRVQAN